MTNLSSCLENKHMLIAPTCADLTQIPPRSDNFLNLLEPSSFSIQPPEAFAPRFNLQQPSPPSADFNSLHWSELKVKQPLSNLWQPLEPSIQETITFAAICQPLIAFPRSVQPLTPFMGRRQSSPCDPPNSFNNIRWTLMGPTKPISFNSRIVLHS